MWFRVDDGLHSHRKAVRAGVPAMGLWVMAGSWSAFHKTGGFVPDYIAEQLDRDCQEHATALIKAGLWRTARSNGERGWRFHDWDAMQPTWEQIEERRQKRSEAGRKGGLKSGQTRSTKQTGSKNEALASPLLPDGRSKHEPQPNPTQPTAANAAAATVPPPLQPLLEALHVANLTARWDKVRPEDLEEIQRLNDVHGTARLVAEAKKAHRPDAPAQFAQAWLEKWRQMRPVSLVPSQRQQKCDQHRQQMPCSGCAADAKIGASA